MIFPHLLLYVASVRNSAAFGHTRALPMARPPFLRYGTRVVYA